MFVSWGGLGSCEGTDGDDDGRSERRAGVKKLKKWHLREMIVQPFLNRWTTSKTSWALDGGPVHRIEVRGRGAGYNDYCSDGNGYGERGGDRNAARDGNEALPYAPIDSITMLGSIVDDTIWKNRTG